MRCARIRCTQDGTSPPAAEGSADPAAAKAPSPAAPADGDAAAAAEGPSLTEQIQTKTSGALDSLQKAVEPAGDSKSADPEVDEFRSLVGEVFANMKESIATGTTQQEGGDVAPEAPAAADAAESKSLASSPAEARRPGLVGQVRFWLVRSHRVSLWQLSFWWCSGCCWLCTSCTASPIRTWCVTTPSQQLEMSCTTCRTLDDRCCVMLRVLLHPLTRRRVLCCRSWTSSCRWSRPRAPAPQVVAAASCSPIPQENLA